MNSSVVYFLGFALVIAGIAYAAITLGVPSIWVIIGAIILIGIALMSTVTKTKQPTTTDTRPVDRNRDRDPTIPRD